METDHSWKKIARSDEISEEKAVSRKNGENDILLVRHEGRVCACGNACTHYGASLNEGVLHGNVVICPAHNSRFDISTGKMLSPPALHDLPTYEVKEEDGFVWIGNERRHNPALPEGTDKRVFIVAGAGAAAVAAAQSLRREGFSGRIMLITAEDALPYDRPTLTKGYISGKAGDDALPLEPEELYDRLDISILRNRTIIALDPEAHTITLDSGESLPFTKLLLATGGTPKKITIPGSSLRGVFTLRTWRDAKAIFEASESAGRIVLLGSGFISMELASEFRARNKQVTIVAPGEVPLASALGEKIGRRLQSVHEANGVTFRLRNTVKEITGNGAVESVMLETGERIPADLVVAGIGVKPEIGYLAGTGIDEDGAVPVDEGFHTALKDIYAAGDIAAVTLPGYGKPVRVEHWAAAERQGMYAARSMLGIGKPYDEPPFFWTVQHDVTLRYIGYASEYDEILFRGDVDYGDFLAGYFKNGKLYAAASIGMSADLMAAGELLRYDIPISESRFIDEKNDIVSYLKDVIR